ncbi:MAG: hypothetical protein DRI69_07485 [Bacteroidetes bacterium]|nr:MAG: hypothetical protein DRI69_07485 [Bacteroidota bacterium]
MRNYRKLIAALLLISICMAKSNAQVLEAEVSVLFEVGSHVITQKADSTLRDFFGELKHEGEKYTIDGRDYIRGEIDRIEIIAHTDAVGKLQYNEILSRHRTESVGAWMVNHHMDTSICILSWKGEIDSLVSNASAPQRKLNRRAQVKVFVNAYITKRMNLIEGMVLDSNEAGIDAQIVIRGKRFLDSTYTDSSGYFSLNAPDTTVYAIDVFAKGYVYSSKMFKNDHRRDVVLSFKPIPLQRGVKFQLHRFYFVGNQAVLLRSSEPELVRLMRFMAINPTTVISIEGHINYPNNPRVSTESKQYDLSVRRAKMVYDYLVEHKINPARMTSEGFGNWHMVFPNARTEDLQRKNRRVEIRIVEQ